MNFPLVSGELVHVSQSAWRPRLHGGGCLLVNRVRVGGRKWSPHHPVGNPGLFQEWWQQNLHGLLQPTSRIGASSLSPRYTDQSKTGQPGFKEGEGEIYGRRGAIKYCGYWERTKWIFSPSSAPEKLGKKRKEKNQVPLRRNGQNKTDGS